MIFPKSLYLLLLAPLLPACSADRTLDGSLMWDIACYDGPCPEGQPLATEAEEITFSVFDLDRDGINVLHLERDAHFESSDPSVAVPFIWVKSAGIFQSDWALKTISDGEFDLNLVAEDGSILASRTFTTQNAAGLKSRSLSDLADGMLVPGDAASGYDEHWIAVAGTDVSFIFEGLSEDGETLSGSWASYEVEASEGLTIDDSYAWSTGVVDFVVPEPGDYSLDVTVAYVPGQNGPMSHKVLITSVSE